MTEEQTYTYTDCGTAYLAGYEAGKADCAKTHAKLLKSARDEAFEAGKKEAAVDIRRLVDSLSELAENELVRRTITAIVAHITERYGLEGKQNG